jgi:hypothetical protein
MFVSEIRGSCVYMKFEVLYNEETQRSKIQFSTRAMGDPKTFSFTIDDLTTYMSGCRVVLNDKDQHTIAEIYFLGEQNEYTFQDSEMEAMLMGGCELRDTYDSLCLMDVSGLKLDDDQLRMWSAWYELGFKGNCTGVPKSIAVHPTYDDLKM